jgi:hypothetical protein
MRKKGVRNSSACDQFHQYPYRNPRFDSIFCNNTPVFKRTVACPRLKNDFPSFRSSLYVRTTNIFWRNSSIFSTTHPTFLHSGLNMWIEKWVVFEPFAFEKSRFNCSWIWTYFRQYSYNVTRFVILFFPGAFITSWVKRSTFHFFRGLNLPLNNNKSNQIKSCI